MIICRVVSQPTRDVRRLRVVGLQHCGRLVAISGLALSVVGPAPAAAHGYPRAVPSPIRVGIAAASTEVSAGSVATFYIRVRNMTGRTLTHLDLGSEVVIAGDPENFKGRWSPALARCGAAGGTAYCSIPKMRPGAIATWTVRVGVPGHLGSGGPSTVGKSVRVFAFVDSNTPGKRVISNPSHASVRIVSGTARLPFTGAPIAVMLLLAGMLITTGGGMLLIVRPASGWRVLGDDACA